MKTIEQIEKHLPEKRKALLHCLHDGMNRVVATPPDASQPSAYGGATSLDFAGKRFELQLQALMSALHDYRINVPRPE